jgi:FlaA1/EpsC-like NDP-sugar epimerase
MIADLSRRPPVRLLAVGAGYFFVLAASLALSLLLRFDFRVPPGYWSELLGASLWILPLKFILLALAGQFRTLLTFFSLPDAKSLALAMGLAGAITAAVWFAVGGQGVPPRGVIVTDTVVSFCALVALRLGMRIYREHVDGSRAEGPRKRTIVVGAGVSGAMLVKELGSKPGIGLHVVAFLEDNPAKIGGTLHGVPVLGPTASLPEIARRLEADKIVIAMPSAPPGKIKSLVAAANELHLEHDIVPSVGQLLSRRVTVSRLRRVEPEDLLGRPPVKLDDRAIGDMLRDRVVLVTGAGGSIGAELCRQIAARRPARLILLDRSEPALFAIHEEVRPALTAGHVVPLAADVCDERGLDRVFERNRPHVVFHAAAHKHVPLMEAQPVEAFRNNVLGTAAAARSAARHGAERFVFISTDKAVNPAGVMGATKRLAELVAQASAPGGGHGVFTAVRFGNVLGSSGSVVPVFHRQIASGGPVTVTDAEATRFFMTIPEAAGLILQSALLARGGETFLLEMGEPVKIDDLARQMIELAGFIPGRDIAITYTGLRSGEKLHEETVATREVLLPTAHPQVRQATDQAGAAFDADDAAALFDAIVAADPDRARELLLEAARQPRPAHLRVVTAATA